ncbi:hypothetical protein [Ectobacillus panaciterrae]|uniref:hypothetical protein n=1 Tax=Ectobacillus panaciterrae TaxID=363872 RepID=UPI000415A5B1|nr:hypothetical protein [Ectobacillus panaciterrae]
MRNEVNLPTLLDKLITEYEKIHGEMIFKFEKQAGKFILIDINQGLLDVVNLTRDEVVGKGLNALFICEESISKLQKICGIAWEGKKVVYYLIPDTNQDIFLVVALKPNMYQGQVIEVVAHCVSLDSKEFVYIANTLASLEPLGILDD